MTRGLQPAEVGQLKALLSRVAAEQGLAPGVHPGVAFVPASAASGGKGRPR
jgi:hypothetical protein